jgi:hypothetical protein
MSQNHTHQTESQAQNQERREFAEAGCDWAFFLIQFLRGMRRLPIQASEIVETQLYKHASEAERKALLLVCDADPEQPLYIEPESKRVLADRDAWLMLFVSGSNLGHADRVAQIRAIPSAVAAREKFDCDLFPQAHYPITTLFSWVFEQR